MLDFTPNPEAEVNVAFDVVQPAVYRMRIVEITEFDSSAGNKCWKARLEYVDPSGLIKLDDTPATNPGNIFDNGLVVAPADKQGRVRNFVEGAGFAWGEISSGETLIGAEVDVKVKLDEYNGEQQNKVARYIKPE